jgi:anti-sigma regulatory factor (Ser/Thr protein kinase)
MDPFQMVRIGQKSVAGGRISACRARSLHPDSSLFRANFAGYPLWEVLMPSGRSDELLLHIADDPVAVAELRRTLTDVAAEAGLSREGAFALRLAATEAVANALRHPGPEHEAVVRIHADEDGVEVEVSSDGPFRLREDTVNHDRGRGLPLIIALMDEAQFSRRDGTTSVRLWKRAA